VGENMILGFLYSLQHIAFLLIHDKRYKHFFIFFSLIVFILIYILKPDTYDIPRYVAAVNFPYYEPLFSLLIIILRPFLSNRNVILVIQFLIGVLTFFVINIYTKDYKNRVDKRVSYILAFFSVAFTLGVNNALRQYMASLIVFISIWFFLNNKFILSLLIFCFAPMIHLSSSMFYFLIIVILLFSKRAYFARRKLTLSFSLINSLFFFISLILIILLPVIVSYTPYASYLDRNIVEGRVDFTLKYLPILLSFVISEYFFGKIKKEDYIFSQLRIIRTFFIVFMFFFIFFNSLNELASRVLGFYFTLEMIVLSLSYVKGYKTGAIIINLSYAFAINAINVIGRI